MAVNDVTISVKADIDRETIDRVSREIQRHVKEACLSGAADALRFALLDSRCNSTTRLLEEDVHRMQGLLDREARNFEKAILFARGYGAGSSELMAIEQRYERDTRHLRECLAHSKGLLAHARRTSVYNLPAYDAPRHTFLGKALSDLATARFFQYEKVNFDPSEEWIRGYTGYRTSFDPAFSTFPFLASGFDTGTTSKEKIVKEKTKKFYVWESDCTGSYPTGFVTEKEANAYATRQARITGRSYTVLKALRRMAKSEPPVKTEPIR